ncbi:DnaJ sub B member 2 [Haplosporangium sp. Z 767]|nr:DnaJ sub B member 2 [Haplosporangium sp. Z 767]
MANDEKPDYYELLCVERSATKDDIRKAYRKQALLFHPDKMKPHMKEEASQHFHLISEAYEILSDDNKRELYNRYGHEGVKAGGDPNPQPEAPFFASRQHDGFGFGFDTPFFSAFGVPAHHQQFHGGSLSSSSRGGVFGSNEDILKEVFSGGDSRPPFYQTFANHHQRHMRNFEQRMGSMFDSFGMFPPRPPMFMDDFGLHHDFFNSGFGAPQQQQQRQQQHARPTLFSTSPFANWSGAGTPMNPFTNLGSGVGGFSSSSSSSSSFGNGSRGGARTSTKTTIVNGQRTTVTEVTDAEGVTTTTVEKPDGSRETFVNGAPAAITGGDSQQPILIPGDNDDRNSRERGGRGGGGVNGYRLGGLNGANSARQDNRFGSSSSSSRNNAAFSSSNQDRRTTATEPIVLDADDDDEMYEDLSRQEKPYREPEHQPPLGHSTIDGNDDDPNLFHPRMGRGQTLRGSSAPMRPRWTRN